MGQFEVDSARAGLSCPGPLLAKLSIGGDLGEQDQEALGALCGDVRTIAAHDDIIREGESPGHVHLILDGWAARYKIVPDGRRQITAFLIPGDMCDAHVAILGKMDHSVVALTQATVAFIPRARIEALPLQRPALARALWWTALVDESVLRAWIVTLGRRDAFEGVAHLLCELHVRLRNVGLVQNDRFDLPLTQEELGDALGMTPVHINRVLQRLRVEGLIRLKRGSLTILDAEGLYRAAGFDPNYLHVRRGSG